MITSVCYRQTSGEMEAPLIHTWYFCSRGPWGFLHKQGLPEYLLGSQVEKGLKEPSKSMTRDLNGSIWLQEFETSHRDRKSSLGLKWSTHNNFTPDTEKESGLWNVLWYSGLTWNVLCIVGKEAPGLWGGALLLQAEVYSVFFIFTYPASILCLSINRNIDPQWIFFE